MLMFESVIISSISVPTSERDWRKLLDDFCYIKESLQYYECLWLKFSASSFESFFFFIYKFRELSSLYSHLCLPVSVINSPISVKGINKTLLD